MRTELDPTRLYYHRVVGNPFHGASAAVGQFVSALSSVMPLAVLAPKARGGDPRFRVPISEAPSLVADLMVSAWVQVQDWIASPRRTQSGRPILIVADIYGALIPLLRSRIQRLPLAYFSLDTGLTIVSSLSRAGVRGSLSLQWLRLPLERLVLANASLIIVRSAGMMDEMMQLGVSREKLLIFPTSGAPDPPNQERIQSVRRGLGVTCDAPLLVFVGNASYPPNRRAIRYICDTLSPQLRLSSPSARLLVVGAFTQEAVTTPQPNMLVLGPVEDLSSLLYACDVGIAPQDVIAGTSTKVLDYVSHGLTTFATPDAVGLMVASPLVHVVAIDAFANAVGEFLGRAKALRSAVAAPAMDSDRHQASILECATSIKARLNLL